MQHTQDHPQEKRHGRLARIRGPLARLLEQLAAENGSTFAIEVNRAAVLLLKQENRWPEPPAASR